MDDVAFIVSCTKKKIWDINPNAPKKVQAKDAYVGNLFKLGKKLAEKLKAPWFIISAKYGILKPTELIENYNVTIDETDLTPEIVRKQLVEKGVFKFKKLVVLASTKYCNLIEKAAELLGIIVETPLKGLPLGMMLAKLKKMLSSNQTKLTDYY